MKHRRNTLAGVSVTLAAFGMSVLVAPPALAAASDCNSGYACLWGNRDYSGGPWRQENDLGLHNTGWWDNDETSSVWNRRSEGALWLYNDTNGGTSNGVWCVPRGYAVPNLDRYNADDRISSFRLTVSGCPSGVNTIGSNKGT